MSMGDSFGLASRRCVEFADVSAEVVGTEVHLFARDETGEIDADPLQSIITSL